MSATRVLLVDDQRIFRVMLREILSAIPDIELLGEATNGHEAIEMAQRLAPDVVLMDIELGSEPNGIQAGHTIKAHRHATGIVLFSTHNVREFIVNAPGWSYLLKNNVADVDTLVRAINGAAWGMVVVDPEVVEAMEAGSDTPLRRLSPGQTKVLELMTQGYDNANIATKLLINETVVEEWQDVIFHELSVEREDGVDPRAKAVSAYLGQTGQGLRIDPQASEGVKPKSSIPLSPLSEMTSEQIRILELVAEGYSDLAIAEELLLDEKSVQEYLDITYHQTGIGADPRIDRRVTVANVYSE